MEIKIREVIRQVARDLSRLFNGSCLSIIIIGAGARDEISFDPSGTILSDLDFLVVLPQKRRILAMIREYQAQAKFEAVKRSFSEKYSVPISVGFANASGNYWLMATPFMYELRENGQVLYGTEAVKSWPAIKQNDQIPVWEGIRLVANRLCEILGHAGSEMDDQPSLIYASLKLFLACSEARLIELHAYQPSYRRRYAEHFRLRNDFSEVQNVFVSSAYRAKLGLDMEFYQHDAELLFHSSVGAGLAYLSKYGFVNPFTWTKRCQAETDGTAGLAADMLFFVRNLAKGSIVSPRHPIAAVYSDALTIAAALGQTEERLTQMVALKRNCADLYQRYRATPQVVSILRREHS